MSKSNALRSHRLVIRPFEVYHGAQVSKHHNIKNLKIKKINCNVSNSVYLNRRECLRESKAICVVDQSFNKS